MAATRRSPRRERAEAQNAQPDKRETGTSRSLYTYTDERGKPLFEVIRRPRKQFVQRRPDGAWNLDGVRRVLYRLPRVVEAARHGDTVYVVEGEKDVHAAEAVGAVATTNPGGALK